MNVCSFVLEVCYPGKKPYFIFSPSFLMTPKASFHETESEAIKETLPLIRKWVDDHYPDGTPLPEITKVKLGSMMFVAQVQS